MPPEQEADMANDLTPRQLHTLQEVEAFLSAHNYPPRDRGNHLDPPISPRTGSQP